MTGGVDGEEFAKLVVEWVEMCEEMPTEVLRLASIGLFSATIMGTPKDKGFLQNGWYFNDGPEFTYTSTQTAEALGIKAEDTQSAIDRMTDDVNQAKFANGITFCNPLPYAERIEYQGHSGKAPDGMVRIAATKWPEFVESALEQWGNS